MLAYGQKLSADNFKDLGFLSKYRVAWGVGGMWVGQFALFLCVLPGFQDSLGGIDDVKTVGAILLPFPDNSSSHLCPITYHLTHNPAYFRITNPILASPT